MTRLHDPMESGTQSRPTQAEAEWRLAGTERRKNGGFSAMGA